MSDGGMGLSFDRAVYSEEGGADRPPCANCRGVLGDRYWTWQKQMLCAGCREKIAGILSASQSSATFGRAALLGSGTALGCGIAYAVFVGLTDYQLALITIGIAFVIAKVVRKASRGIGGRRYQILAVALTYVASAMGYAPAVVKGIREAAKHDTTAQVAESASASPPRTQAEAAPPTTAKPDEPAPPSQPPPSSKPTLGGLFAALAFLFAIVLASPILAATEAPIGLLIVIFGLWEAWKLSAGLSVQIEGPFETRAVSTESTAA